MRDEAIQQFQQAIAAAPSNATYHGTLGSVYLEQQRYDEAVESLKKAIKYDPGYHDAYVNLGCALTSLGRPAEALDQFHEALEIEPHSAEAYFQMGNALCELGELEDAVGEYRQAIYHRPESGPVHYNLAVLLARLGRNREAIEHYQHAARLAPSPQCYHNLALLHAAAGQTAQAIASFQEALMLRPDVPGSLVGLANLLSDEGRLEEAARAYTRALELQPNLVEAQCGLGQVLLSAGRLSEAREQFEAALAGGADSPSAMLGLNNVLIAEGKLGEAAESARRMIARWPQSAEAHTNLGIALARQGRTDEALAAYRQAIALDPQLGQARYNQGVLEQRMGRLAEAEASFRTVLERERENVIVMHALAGVLNVQGKVQEGLNQLAKILSLAPNFADAHNTRGVLLLRQGKYAEAEDAFATAIRLRPEYVEAYSNRGMALKDEGRLDEALEDYVEALRIAPSRHAVRSDYIMSMNYTKALSPAQILAENRIAAERLSQGIAPLPPATNARDPERQVRIGYVSADLRNNPVGYFFEALARHHDRQRFAMYCYANQWNDDETTERLRGMADQWRSIARDTDEAVAARIREDGIDILVDLSGHTAGNRLRLFALRPAPVQASWLGYFGTTGLPAIDYVIGDRYVTPPDEEEFYTERAARLPASYLCFTPPAVAVEPGPLPALAAGYVTFASFNNLAKVGPEVIDAWSEALKSVPNSRLFLKYKALADERVRTRLAARFADQGIDPARLRLEGESPRAELLARYREVDIALDTFPFGGGTTTAEALWMGVPVVTLTGDRFVSHVGESILNNAGMEELVTHSQPRYVAKAAELAGNLPQLAALRSGLRAQLLQSAFCDGPAFAKAFEALLRQMWRTWCSGA
jgi:predicted O-linked N-acetylglucosamine transferase (SPINDLY family)